MTECICACSQVAILLLTPMVKLKNFPQREVHA